MALDKNLLFHGTEGRVYIDGYLAANVRSVEAKKTINKEEIYVNGDYGAKHIPTGYSIAGTLTGWKTDSYWLEAYRNAFSSGVFPDTIIVAKIHNPSTGATERVALYGVLPDEVMLSKFENNTLIEEEIPFTADRYEILDLI